ncbi:MAG: CTP synthase [Parachlamydiales bacterium]|jgi:CTP synthase
MSVKYIFVTGGVVSSLGKGLAAASLAMLLERKGLKIAMLKIDPYLNIDPGTMSPFQHGEVYVTDDGTETDLDLGHYYRFTHSPLSKASNVTSGQIYDTIIRRERKGDYLGKTVQVIPHVTEEIKRRLELCARQNDKTEVVFVEIGGTVGDIESLPFLEAIRQFKLEHSKECLNIHLTYVPYIKAAGEVKTKPTQQSVQLLRSIGIIPDIILCRAENALSDEIKSKISLFCNVEKSSVFDAKDVENSIYEVPLELHSQKIDDKICERLNLKTRSSTLSDWKKMIFSITHPQRQKTIGIVGKYVDHQDAYKSVFEALFHAASKLGCRLEIKRFESDKINTLEDLKNIKGCDGYLIPGGFGDRGWLGKILAAQYCRENRIPYFGLCLGMQVMIVEFARNVLKLKEASSTEMDPSTPDPVISLLVEQKKIKDLGGTMRLGAYPCLLKPKSKAFQAYKKKHVSERHRHRYEFNNLYKAAFEKAGMVFSGVYENKQLLEIAEIKNHPWMLGTQYHPEFKSKPLAPHPLFLAFVKAVLKAKKKKT